VAIWTVKEAVENPGDDPPQLRVGVLNPEMAAMPTR
jgi:hypothetical protein